MDSGVIFGILGLLVGFIGIFLSIMFYMKQRNRRSFSYQIVSSASVVSVSQEVKSKVKVQFEGKSVEDAHQVILKIWNSGDPFAFIRPDEFTIPIKFNFGNAEVLGTPEILETEPSELKDRVSLKCDAKNENVTLEPLLLNSKDSIKWKVLLTGFKGNIKVEGRIAGIKEIRRLDQISYVTTTYRWLIDAAVSIFSKRLHKH